MTPAWRPVVGFEGKYEVSDEGGVRGLERADRFGRRIPARVFSPTPSRSGHLQVTLRDEGYQVTRKVHRLVLEAFVGKKPAGMECRHLDDDKTNNHLSNLRWGSRSENQFDRVRNGLHHQRNKDACPRGHALREPNLVGAWSRRGFRNCRACRLAQCGARRNGVPFTDELADDYYKRILDGSLRRPNQPRFVGGAQ